MKDKTDSLKGEPNRFKKKKRKKENENIKKQKQINVTELELYNEEKIIIITINE